MEQRGNIVSFRPDVRVLDCTIRDGGLVNDFFFTDEFVKKLYEANVAAGVDYMEIGYKASKDLFDESKFGKWKFCDEDNIRAIVGDNETDLKISVMADVGRTEYKRDIINKADSAIDMVRVATYINTVPAAIEMAEYCKSKGYETSINIMAISNASDNDITDALDIIGHSTVDKVCVVDSYGALVPEQIRKIALRYLEMGDKYGKQIGIHAHNNQQLAFANTIETLRLGASILDASADGLGRGAGNCPSELLLRFLKNPKYKVISILDFIEKYVEPLKAEGMVWGYDVPYMLTGSLNQHPRDAIAFTKAKRKDIKNFYVELLEKE
jgi:4-hydroxy 2-oxovalerate aldolase